MNKIQILLVDDHATVRAGLRLLLESQPDMAIIGEAADGLEAIKKTRDLRPDVVVMDLALPGLSGFEATRRIKTEFPKTQVLALTMYEDDRYFFRILHAGALGYVVKGAPPADFVAAVRSVHRGHAYLYPSLARKLLDDYLTREKEGREAFDDLTDREREVLRLTAQGLTGKEIASLLGLSAHTVERHRQKLMAKLNLHNRTELIKYAIRKGLIELEA